MVAVPVIICLYCFYVGFKLPLMATKGQELVVSRNLATVTVSPVVAM